jgi:hypothetical protein
LGRTTALVYLLLWAVTLAAAVTVTLALAAPTRGLLGLRLSPAATPPPSLTVAATLAAHNLPVCGWPLLLPTAGATRSRRSILAAHALLAASLTANAALVGGALGAYGSRLLAYTPQLPFEWLALAAGAAGWLALHARRDGRLRMRIAALMLVSVLAAAALETYAVPYTQQASAPALAHSQGGQREAAGDIQAKSHP